MDFDPWQAFIRFGIDPSGRYIACCASDGRMVIHDMEAARKHRLRVKEAQLRMGISGYHQCTLFSLCLRMHHHVRLCCRRLATEPKIVRPPTPDPPRRSHDSSASVNASRRSVSPGKVSSAGRPPIAKAAIVTASTRRSKRAHKHAVERSLISDDDEKDVWSGAADSDSSSDSSLSVEGPSSSSRRDTGGSGVERVKLQSPARAGSDRIGTGVVTSKLIDTVFPKPAPGTDVKAALSAAAQAKRSTSVRPTIREYVDVQPCFTSLLLSSV